jgi:glycosyltransferase involved in cell wall biosynthesis
LLAVGSVIPRKGFDILVDALSGLADHDWHLRIAGSLDAAPETTAALLAQIADRGLSGSIDCLGSLGRAELDALYHRSDIFVSASHYEGYGMALAEALARGLPIITTTGGAAGETAPREASLQVPPGDTAALRDALRRLLTEPDLRRSLSAAAWRAGSALPSWPDTARRIAAIVRQVAERSQS